MEHRQHGQSSRRYHTLYDPQRTNRWSSKDGTVPRHQYRKRGYHIRVSLDGRIRTKVHVEAGCHQRKGITYNPPVSKPLHSRKGTNNRTNPRGGRGSLGSSYDFHRARHSSTTIHQKGGSSRGIPTIHQSIQRRRLEAIPTKEGLGPRNRVQKGRTRSHRL